MKYKKQLFLSIIFLHINLCALFETIAPGVYYKNLVKQEPSQSIHLLVVNPHKVNIKIGMAHDKCASAEKTSDMAKKHNVIAAINGGFFDFGNTNRFQLLAIVALDCLGISRYKAYPVYTLNSDNSYCSLSHVFTGALGWNNKDQHPLFSIIKTDITLNINGQEYVVNELNKPHPTKPTLYSDAYDEQSPYFRKPVNLILIEDNQIKKIHSNFRGKKKIPKGGWLYVLPLEYKDQSVSLKEGDPVTINITHSHGTDYLPSLSQEKWPSMDHILASTPLLIYKGDIPSYLEEQTSEFYTKKHPRTAIGLLKNGNWVFIVIDGGQKHSEGFTILELAQFMKKLGCTGALNLDGGGSSTMVIQNKMVNSPSGRTYSLFRKERPISNTLLICSKNQDNSQ